MSQSEPEGGGASARENFVLFCVPDDAPVLSVVPTSPKSPVFVGDLVTGSNRPGRRGSAPARPHPSKLLPTDPLKSHRPGRRATAHLNFHGDSALYTDTEGQRKAANLVVQHVPRFVDLALDPPADLDFEVASGNCEWNNKLFFVANKNTPTANKIVVRKTGEGFGNNLGSEDLEKFLDRKKIAEIACSDAGLGPKLHGVDGNRWFITEFLPGGNLTQEDLNDERQIEQLGRLVGNFHQIPNPFNATKYKDINWDEIWKATNFINQHFFDITPESAWVALRKHNVARRDVKTVLDNLSVNPIFTSTVADNSFFKLLGSKKTNPMYEVVTLHNDIHPMNCVYDEDKKLHVIDYDWTYYGFAGAEFGLMALMTFGYLPKPNNFECEDQASIDQYVSPTITPLPLQRKFAFSYLKKVMNKSPSPYEVELFLFDMQKWSYWGFIRMGLAGLALGHLPYCSNFPSKRPYLRALASTFLNKGFLKECRMLLREADCDDFMKMKIVKEGLGFMAMENHRKQKQERASAGRRRKLSLVSNATTHSGSIGLGPPDVIDSPCVSFESNLSLQTGTGVSIENLPRAA